MNTNKDMLELQEKLKKLEQQTTNYLKEIKILVANRSRNDQLKYISYFTYSTNISHDKNIENMIIGTYHIHNIGNKTITNPYICLKLSPNSPFQFSGKYINKKSNLSLKTNDAWERINEQSDNEEYWLKPLEKAFIASSEMISFPNFQVKWLPKESYSGSMTGFTYCDELKKGVPAINQINISGYYSN